MNPPPKQQKKVTTSLGSAKPLLIQEIYKIYFNFGASELN